MLWQSASFWLCVLPLLAYLGRRSGTAGTAPRTEKARRDARQGDVERRAFS